MNFPLVMSLICGGISDTDSRNTISKPRGLPWNCTNLASLETAVWLVRNLTPDCSVRPWKIIWVTTISFLALKTILRATSIYRWTWSIFESVLNWTEFCFNVMLGFFLFLWDFSHQFSAMRFENHYFDEKSMRVEKFHCSSLPTQI